MQSYTVELPIWCTIHFLTKNAQSWRMYKMYKSISQKAQKEIFGPEKHNTGERTKLERHKMGSSTVLRKTRKIQFFLSIVLTLAQELLQAQYFILYFLYGTGYLIVTSL